MTRRRAGVSARACASPPPARHPATITQIAPHATRAARIEQRCLRVGIARHRTEKRSISSETRAFKLSLANVRHGHYTRPALHTQTCVCHNRQHRGRWPTMAVDGLREALGDRYTIERELGRGGMATVYLATDTKVGRRVAIKVLLPELAAAVGGERFHREIQIATRLTHPNILPVYDSGEADGTLYYVIPFVEGESLRERLDRERQLGIDEAIRITCQVAYALDHAHSAGIVHRDIKPENILLEAGQAVVADFGIARAVTGAADVEALTRTGMSLGTPAYMSPEQAMGERTLDGRSDQYALACVTYEMLTGQPPFSAPTMQALIARHIAEQVPLITTVRQAVPDAVQDVILQALEKVPADRFPTIGHFAQALADAGAMSMTATTRRATPS